MNIRILGTGYGECRIKNKISKDFRKSGGVVIDDRILLDAPEDVIDAADELGFSDLVRTVSVILISHSHPGHFSVNAINKFAARKKIRILASREVLAKIPQNPNIEKIEIRSYTQFTIGEYCVTVLPTNHETDDRSEECFNFLFTGTKNLFYALDGAGINTRAWKILRHAPLDILITDFALCDGEVNDAILYHNDIDALIRMKSILTSHNVLHDKTKFILSHIPSDKKRNIHEELEPIATRNGFILAYDGYFTRV